MSEFSGNGQGNSAPVGNAQSPSGTPQGGDQGSGGGGPWYSSFTSGLERSEAEAFTGYASRYQSQQDFAKATVNLRKSHDSRMPIPAQDAPEETLNEIYDKLGRPKDPSAYQFNHLQDAPPLADVEQEARENFRGVAHRLGLTQKQIDGLTQWNDTFRKTQYEAFDKAPEFAAKKAKETLTSKYGPDLDRNLNVYRNTVKEYFGNELQSASQLRLEDGSFVLDHPAIADAFIRVGLERAEDQRGTPMLNSGEMESTKSQIAAIEEEAAKNKRLTSEEPYHSKLRPLYQKLYGKANIGNSIYNG